MTTHIRSLPALLALCLSLAATGAFAGEGPTAPLTPTTPAAPAAPVTPAAAPVTPAAAPAPAPADAPAAPSPPDEDAWQARAQAQARRAEERARRQEAAAESRMNAAERRANEETRQREEALRGQMDAARHRLEAAAQQLAALSAQMYGPMAKRFAAFGGPPHALIGVQLDNSHGHEGARVREVSPGGPAQRAGVRAGDLIVGVNGTDVHGHEPAGRVVELLHDVKPGDKVHLKVLRDGKTQDLTVTARMDGNDVFVGLHMPNLPDLPQLPEMRALSQWGGPMIIHGPVADMELSRLTPGLGRYFGTDSGVLVVRAPAKGGLGLQDGDVILSIAGRKPTDSSHVIRILGSYDPGEKITLEVMRMRRRISVTTTLPAESSLPRTPLMLHEGDVLDSGPVIRVRTHTF